MDKSGAFNIVGVTCPLEVEREVDYINSLLYHGLSKIHIRKQGWSAEKIRQLISGIDGNYRDRLALHQNHELAEDLEVKHLHFKEADRKGVCKALIEGLKESGFTLSTSAHFECLLPDLDSFDYVFFGPVFDSISKSGYQSTLPDNFRLNSSLKNVYAIGGVSDTNIETVMDMGFSGAALLGALWTEPAAALDNYLNIMKQCQQHVPLF